MNNHVPTIPVSYSVLTSCEWGFMTRKAPKKLLLSADVETWPANDVIVLEGGAMLPLVDACVLQVDLDVGRIVVARGFAAPG